MTRSNEIWARSRMHPRRTGKKLSLDCGYRSTTIALPFGRSKSRQRTRLQLGSLPNHAQLVVVTAAVLAEVGSGNLSG